MTRPSDVASSYHLAHGMSFDPAIVETLLNMSESETLDFKRDQYRFVGASDAEKFELVKDILAFANAWKTSDAHILIGVNEDANKRAVPCGVSEHLNDADVQQLVNSKTNVPVRLDYIPVERAGMQIGVLRIAAEQKRPIFLRKALGNLKPNVVYIRRGTSTAEAAPDEVAQMGASAVTISNEPVITLELGRPADREPLGHLATVTSMLLDDPPPVAEEPDPVAALPLVARLFNERLMRTPLQAKEWAKYKRTIALAKPLGFYVQNLGRVLVEDVRIVVAVPKLDGLELLDELPEEPRGYFPAAIIRPPLLPGRRVTYVSNRGNRWEVEARIPKIQPKAEAWSAPFFIGSDGERELDLVARVYADNIPSAPEFPVKITISVGHGVLTDDDEEDANGDE